MKKKIIISLFLAMCCIMASIPASAVENECITHDWEYYYCARASTPYREYTHSDGYVECTYQITRYYAVFYCTYCYDVWHAYETEHTHEIVGHIEDCGDENETDMCIYC